MCGTSLWGSTSEQAVDLGFALMPNDHYATREVWTYGTEVRAIYVYWVVIPGGGGMSPVERPLSLVIGDIVGVVAVRGDA